MAEAFYTSWPRQRFKTAALRSWFLSRPKSRRPGSVALRSARSRIAPAPGHAPSSRRAPCPMQRYRALTIHNEPGNRVTPSQHTHPPQEHGCVSGNRCRYPLVTFLLQRRFPVPEEGDGVPKKRTGLWWERHVEVQKQQPSAPGYFCLASHLSNLSSFPSISRCALFRLFPSLPRRPQLRQPPVPTASAEASATRDPVPAAPDTDARLTSTRPLQHDHPKTIRY
jgi:hypothetical protein